MKILKWLGMFSTTILTYLAIDYGVVGYNLSQINVIALLGALSVFFFLITIYIIVKVDGKRWGKENFIIEYELKIKDIIKDRFDVEDRLNNLKVHLKKMAIIDHAICLNIINKRAVDGEDIKAITEDLYAQFSINGFTVSDFELYGLNQKIISRMKIMEYENKINAIKGNETELENK